jgi:hypothetical protein
MQFPAGARDLFSSPKHPRQLGQGDNPPPFEWVSGPLSRAGEGAQIGRGMKLILHLHLLLRIRMRTTTPCLLHYDFIVCSVMNTGTVLPLHTQFSPKHLKILNHTTENKFQRLGLFCSFQGKRQGHDVLAPW